MNLLLEVLDILLPLCLNRMIIFSKEIDGFGVASELSLGLLLGSSSGSGSSNNRFFFLANIRDVLIGFWIGSPLELDDSIERSNDESLLSIQ